MKVETIELGAGDDLASLIKQLTEKGVTDFSKVRVEMYSVGCQVDHGDNYCYCPSSYADIRLEWKI